MSRIVNEVTDSLAAPAVDHRHLRSAIEFAVTMAEAGQRLRPPLAFPAELKPFLKQPRVPAAALGRLRRAIEADEVFRRRLGAGAVPELVDPIGMEWLHREPGWEARLDELVATAERVAEEADASAALRKAERRREAAEQAAARTRAELVQLQARVEELTRALDEARGAAAATFGDARLAREELAAARLATRHANDRAEAARGRLAGVESARDQALARAEHAEAQRDALLAERAERAGVTLAAGQVTEVRELARSARALADRLAGFVGSGAAERKPLSLPGGVARDSRRATEHLLRVEGAAILIDGYNVAKLAWPEVELIDQRLRCLDLVDDLVRRLGGDVTVVFDGADVVGSHAKRRRLSRVVFSPAGVLADDVLRAEVAGLPPQRPVVVVTNDQAIRRDVAAAGANVVSSDAFLATVRC